MIFEKQETLNNLSAHVERSVMAWVRRWGSPDVVVSDVKFRNPRLTEFIDFDGNQILYSATETLVFFFSGRSIPNEGFSLYVREALHEAMKELIRELLEISDQEPADSSVNKKNYLILDLSLGSFTLSLLFNKAVLPAHLLGKVRAIEFPPKFRSTYPGKINCTLNVDGPVIKISDIEKLEVGQFVTTDFAIASPLTFMMSNLPVATAYVGKSLDHKSVIIEEAYYEKN